MEFRSHHDFGHHSPFLALCCIIVMLLLIHTKMEDNKRFEAYEMQLSVKDSTIISLVKDLEYVDSLNEAYVPIKIEKCGNKYHTEYTK